MTRAGFPCSVPSRPEDSWTGGEAKTEKTLMGVSEGSLAPWTESYGSQVPRFLTSCRCKGALGSRGKAWVGSKHLESWECFGGKQREAQTEGIYQVQAFRDLM